MELPTVSVQIASGWLTGEARQVHARQTADQNDESDTGTDSDDLPAR
jgi:hypothetical protein